MPSSAASRRRALTVSAPARWPSTTGRSRPRAQRPLPSVMIATYRAARPAPASPPISRPAAADGARGAARASDLEDLRFLALEQPVELGDVVVGELLQLDLGAVLVVGARLAGVLELAQVVHDVAADVADRHAALLRDVADHLDQLAAALLVELGDVEADEPPVVVRRQADVGLHD